MRFLRKLQLRIRGLFHKHKFDAEMDEEMRGHIEMRTEQNIQSGMPPDQAHYAALRQFGWVQSIKETCRDQRGVRWLEDFGKDLRFGGRMLRKNPGFTATAVLTLALGIGANTGIFSVVNAVLLRPLPYRDADRLITLWESNPQQGYDQNFAATGTFLDWKQQSRSFESMAIFQSNLGFALTGQGEPERITGTKISANLFHVLGVSPILGRSFTPDEETSGRGQVAILSYGLWQRRFGGNPKIIGQPVTLDGKPFQVVGVMPAKINFPGMTGVLFGVFVNQPSDVWVPLALDGEARQTRGNHSWQVIAKLKSGISLAQASAEMDAIQLRLEQEHRGEYMGTHTKLIPLRTLSVRDVRLGLLILLGAVAFVLLVACANVANLLLARATARQKEMSVRLALGAGRGRIVRQLLTESLVLALAGTTFGALAARIGIGSLAQLVPGTVAAATPGWEDIRIDLAVLGFTLVVALVTTILFGLAPAWQAARTDLQDSLKEGGRGGSAGGGKHALRGALVSAQVAVTLMLLIGAGLLIQSFSRLEHVNPGFQPARLLTMELHLPASKYPQDHHKAAFFDQLLERLKTAPGVESVGLTLIVPFGGGGYNFGIKVEGREKDVSGKLYTADWRPITPDYFRTIGVPLVQGRMLTEHDNENSQRVLLINQAFARAFLPGEDPIGKHIRGFGANAEYAIVGVVRDFKQWTLDTDVRAEMYTAQAQTPWLDFRTVVVRSTNEAAAVARVLRSEVRALDPDLPIAKLQTMETLMSDSVAQPRFRTFLLTLFAGLAVVLAAIGIYGVMAYSVSQRIREIGIRMALGAQRRDVLSLVIGQGLKLSLFGILIGILGAFALTRVMRTLLFQTQASDPLTFLAVPIFLLMIAVAACWLPARRATKIHPMTALRTE